MRLSDSPLVLRSAEQSSCQTRAVFRRRHCEHSRTFARSAVAAAVARPVRSHRNPVYLADGSFFGTLCAIDPARRRVTDEAIVEMFSDYARTVGRILSEVLGLTQADGEAAAA